tara:strand:- start:216 stop:422 length:207 start_codon:yes stop_codon:yes gene_type:complete
MTKKIKNNKVSKEAMDRIEKWMDLKKQALRLFGQDSIEYFYVKTQLDFLLKINDLEIHELTIGFMKKK